MKYNEINTIPGKAVFEGPSEEVFTEGFGYYFIHCYVKGTRRYFELHGFYVGKHFFSSSINEDRGRIIDGLKEYADYLIHRPINQK